MPRYWKYWLPRAFCWTGAFWCADHFLKCLRLTFSDMWVFYMRTSMTTIRDGNYSPGQDLLIICLGVILFIAGYLLSAKMYAAAAGIPFKKIFGLPVKITLGIWATVYLVSGGMAVAQHRAAERTVAELGEFFGYPLNADGVNALLRKTGWSDGIRHRRQFPDKLVLGYANYYTKLYPVLWNNDVILPKKLRQQWQEEIEQLKPLAALEREMEKPYQPGFVPLRESITSPTSNWYWRYGVFCRFERWRTVFLLEKNQLGEALKALRRMETAL